MALTFDANGVVIQTLQEIYDELADGYKAIYGNEINVDPDSPDGQRIAIEAQERLDMQMFGEWLYNQFDPDTAIGNALSRLIKLAGLSRLSGRRSQADLTVVTSKVLTLQRGWTVQDSLGQKWVALSNWALASGSNTITVFSDIEGPIEAATGTITSPITVILGVVSVTNAAPATPGRSEETDEELRIRRNRSIENPSSSTVGGLFSALGAIYNVTGINIVENATSVYDSTNNLNPHSLWIIIDGGSAADIAEVVALNKTGGTGLKGSTIGTYNETITRPDGSTFEYTHAIPFDRSTEVDLYVRMNATRAVSTTAVDTDAIKSALASKSFRIGESAQAGSLYATCYQATSTGILSAMEVSLDGSTWTSVSITPDADEKFTIDTANVTITVS